jgi:hypothetical protein
VVLAANDVTLLTLSAYRLSPLPSLAHTLPPLGDSLPHAVSDTLKAPPILRQRTCNIRKSLEQCNTPGAEYQRLVVHLGVADHTDKVVIKRGKSIARVVI